MEIFENLTTRMPILIRTVDGINNRVAKNSNGTAKESPYFRRLARTQNLASKEDLISYLNQFDPTENGAKYTQWIVKIVGEGRLNLPEDGERLLRTLGIFDKVKNSKVDINKDINSYNNFRDFEQIMMKYRKAVENNNLSVAQWEKWVATKGFKKVYSDGRFTLIRFDNTGEMIKVFPNKVGAYESSWLPEQFATGDTKLAEFDLAAVSMSKLAAGTSYCVAHPGTAASYLNAGPLYAIFKDGEFILLADYSWESFANREDRMISTASPQIAFFLSKALITNPSEISNQKAVANIIKNTLENHQVSNEKAINIMTRAVQSVLGQ